MKQRKLTDVHIHLEQYTPEEMALVLERATEAGVGWMLTAGMDIETSARAVELAAGHEEVLAAVGIHPWVAAESFPHDFYDRIRPLARAKVTVAIGEVGLDYVDNVFRGVTYHDNEPLQRNQEQAFRTQVQLACELKLPIVVHCRQAYATLIPILKEERAHRVGGVVHNYDGDEQVAGQLVDMGFYISFGGALTYPEATAVRKVARRAPLTAILLETDAPYMPLYEQTAEKNEPANVARVAQTLAHLRGVDVEELAGATQANFEKLLGLAGH